MKKFRLATISAAVCLASMVSAHAADTPVRINQAFQSLLYLPLYVAQEQHRRRRGAILVSGDWRLSGFLDSGSGVCAENP